MEDEDNELSGTFGGKEWTAEELSAEFNRALAELGWTPVELADRLISLGDYRPYKTVLRGIHRAVEGQVKVSGELLAFVRQEVRYKRRLKRAYGNLEWSRLGDGSWTVKVEDFIITLLPQTKGRWKVHMTHAITGYSPSWPRWQDTLEGAKEIAFLTLDSAINWLLEQEQEEHERRQRGPRRAINLDG
ncbi:hypothetical protein [Rhizobium leguminosarum]|uniref:Uncharacterized protein n=1 Tax=Rhizobium leguminosarum TaxID=384 RepID=A0A7M3DQG9_RHILE|nr:hypothetical protein [Rhizobium leguminosarum]TAY50936.1 hypothetical protein ELH90_04040 [Rhizobium leguminosarum]